MFKEYWDAEKNEAAIGADQGSKSGGVDDTGAVADILLSLQDPLLSAGNKRKRSACQGVAGTSSQPRKSRRIGTASKVARALAKSNPKKMDVYYAQMDGEFQLADDRFVSFAAWLATLREGAKSTETKPMQAATASSSKLPSHILLQQNYSPSSSLVSLDNAVGK